MPHVSVKHLPVDLSSQDVAGLVDQLTTIICATFKTQPVNVSIALEPVPQDKWADEVYLPSVLGHTDLLVKEPQYRDKDGGPRQ
ncbi:hypothetical protein [Leifsonia shinshuensis]